MKAIQCQPPPDGTAERKKTAIPPRPWRVVSRTCFVCIRSSHQGVSIASPIQQSINPTSLVSLLDFKLHLLIRLVKLARLPLRLHLSDNLLENFHRFQTAFAFVAFDQHLDASIGRYRDFKFALGHNSFQTFNIQHSTPNIEKAGIATIEGSELNVEC
jgi:hypothetical protein